MQGTKEYDYVVGFRTFHTAGEYDREDGHLVLKDNTKTRKMRRHCDQNDHVMLRMEETESEDIAVEKTWHFSESHQSIINTLVHYYVDPCISFIRKKCNIELSDVLDQTLVVIL